MAPIKSERVSMNSRSYGSWIWPSTTFVTGSGLETWNSNSSRLNVSTSIASCNSPLPEPWNLSALSVGSTRRLTLVRSSLVRRSCNTLEVQ